ncbi:glutaminyl-peptide cyclotransferase [Sphingosinicella sp. BN140058]|uniref:glutaminyl-peptide cyclotransferase n=1 Tax=Sphingosinicella sp. BN140058 TaxID=1892855 RepID=UPI001013B28B|nr:glutaminyl-peptide cyclotransferase [Sphingosinicella sp. BN140058]QAY75138.1 glutaminyl-peptide cyclotransferase [Sphingosinicella sp. BN140058]
MRQALFLFLLAVAGCSASDARDTAAAGYKVVRAYPHDPSAFTEGLLWRDGKLYESTGLNGQSDIREVRLDDGKVLRKVTVPSTYFGEGIVDWGDEIVSLTWQNGIGFRWNRADFRQTGTFQYPGEGWALTRDKANIYMSDGTAQLRVLDPKTMAEKRRISVTDQGMPVERLNELEWVNGEIFANVWMTPRIARIDPATGNVKGWIDLTDLVAANAPADPDAVLNGIAYDAAKDRLFVTGKNWSKLFEIDLVPAR